MAALDFPASPTVGQVYPPAPITGVPVYTWDGEKWTTKGGAVGSTGAWDDPPLPDIVGGAAGSSTEWSRGDHAHPPDPAKVSKTGDTMTGSLLIEKSGGASNIYGSAVGGNLRWGIALGNQDADTGGNAGSHFVVSRFNDGGVYMDSPLVINRTNAFATFGSDIFVTGTVNASNSVSLGANAAVGVASNGSTLSIKTHGTGTLSLENQSGGVYAQFASFGAYILTGLQASGDINTQLNRINIANFSAGLYSDSATTTLSTAVNGRMDYFKGSGTFRMVVNEVVYHEFRTDAMVCFAATAYKPGGGSWADSNSDIRTKNIQGEYTSGLEEVAKLRPVIYTFKGNNTKEPPGNIEHPDPEARAKKEGKSEAPVSVPYPNSTHYAPAVEQKVYYGLIAQEAEIPFPEMVGKSAGFIDGKPVTDLRSMDTTPLIYALVNAVKELKARVEALEAA